MLVRHYDWVTVSSLSLTSAYKPIFKRWIDRTTLLRAIPSHDDILLSSDQIPAHFITNPVSSNLSFHPLIPTEVFETSSTLRRIPDLLSYQ